MKIEFCVVCFVLLVTCNNSNAQFDGDDCTLLHNREAGICRNARNCPEVYELYRKGVKYTTCSHSSGTHFVCCPQKTQKTQKTSSWLGMSAKKCKEYQSAVKKVTAVASLSTILKPHFISSDTCTISTGLVFGGVKAKKGEFPHSAALGNRGVDINFFCGGSLISKNFVLTAAHCKRGNVKSIFVRLGDLNIENESDGLSGIDIALKEFIKHEQHNRFTKENDIALAKLETSVTFSDLVRPACLWQDASLNVDTVIATGWGRTESSGDKNSDDLLKVSLDLFDIKRCSQFFEKQNDEIVINQNQICAGVLDGASDTCQGDSGGPIQIVLPDHKCIYQIVGLTSFGSDFCGAKNSPSVYTRVSSYIPWIEEKVWG